ncbi:MAG: hypothetical protein AB7K09_05660 [Planctomycetota bacterium]
MDMDTVTAHTAVATPRDLDDLRIALARFGRLACVVSAHSAVELLLQSASDAERTRVSQIADLLMSYARGSADTLDMQAAQNRLREESRESDTEDAIADRHRFACLIDALGSAGPEPRDATMWCVQSASRLAADPDRFYAEWWSHTCARLQFNGVRTATCA